MCPSWPSFSHKRQDRLSNTLCASTKSVDTDTSTIEPNVDQDKHLDFASPAA
jgi:hypothetical protein